MLNSAIDEKIIDFHDWPIQGESVRKLNQIAQFGVRMDSPGERFSSTPQPFAQKEEAYGFKNCWAV